MSAPRVFTWDWRESPNWDEINEALKEFPTPHFCWVDTGSDCSSAVLTNEPITVEEAQQIHDSQE